MVNTKALLSLLLIVAVTGVEHTLRRRGTSDDGLKLVCYYSNWAVYRPGLAKFTPENINPYLCTHVIYAFGALSSELELTPFDPYNDIEQGNYKTFVGLKSYNPRLKTMIAVGGWNEGSRRFSKLVESSHLRQKFIRSALKFVRQHGFDGLDLDWEYPAFREGGNSTDKKGYAQLIKELRAAINEERLPAGKDRLLLSVAVPATKTYIEMGFDVPIIAKSADFLNLLSYDYHSAYEPQTHHHAPLFHSPDLDPDNHFRDLNVHGTVSHYLRLGCPKEKIIVGVPMYGRSYKLATPKVTRKFLAPADGPGDEGLATREKGYLAYYEICQKVKDDNWDIESPYPDLMGPYAYKDNQWVGFDEEEMISIKARYILDNGLGGAMVWTLDNDDFRGICTDEQSPLVNTLRNSLFFSNVIEGSFSQQSLSRSAGPAPPSTILFDDEANPEEGTPRRRNTLKKLVQNRQSARRNRNNDPSTANRQSNRTNEGAPFTTPAPPPTPDPSFSFECKDEGFFNNPKDCKKYFWCLDSGPANLGVVAHAFTCPSGLFFNAATESCDYPENVVCLAKSSSTSEITSIPASRLARPQKSQTTTTSTTTQAPTTRAPRYEEPAINQVLPGTGVTPAKSENVAELLRLLQAIGGVEKLQSLLGSQAMSTSSSVTSQTLPRYDTPKRHEAPSTANLDTTNQAQASQRRPKSENQQGFTLPDEEPRRPLLEPNAGNERNVDDGTDNFPFQYQTPPRDQHTESHVKYVDDVPMNIDEETPDFASPDAFSYGTPPQRQSSKPLPHTPASLPSEQDGSQRNTGSRNPVRVQVVRVPNNRNAGGDNVVVNNGGVRRRMRVRVGPDGNRIVDEAPQSHQGRAVSREESSSAADAGPVVVRDPNAIPINTVQGQPDVRRQAPPPNSDNVNVPENIGGQGGAVRLVTRHRRPNADAIVNHANNQANRVRLEGNYVAVRRQVTAPAQPQQPRESYPPPSTTTTRRPLPRTTTRTTTTTTPPTTPKPKPLPPRKEEDEEEEYDDEYEEYEDYVDDDETTTVPATTTTSTTSKPTTTAPRSLLPRRRVISATASTTKRPTQTTRKTTSAPRRAVYSTPRSQTSSASTTQRTPTPSTSNANKDSKDDKGVVVRSDSDVECFKRGVFIHPTECSKFVVCAPSSRASQGLRGRVLLCPADQIYLEDIGRCMKGDRKKCEKL